MAGARLDRLRGCKYCVVCSSICFQAIIYPKFSLFIFYLVLTYAAMGLYAGKAPIFQI